MTLPADIEAAIANVVRCSQDAGRSHTSASYAIASTARQHLETVIAKHLRGMAEMKAALEAQTSGA